MLQRDVPVFVEAIGQTRGGEEVEVRARVEGYLESVEFQEGSYVRKGQRLYTIDPREYEAAVAEAKTAVEGGDATAMADKSQALAQVSMKLGQAIYEKDQAANAGATGGGAEDVSGGTDQADDVVDAEFSEVDENKG